MPPSLELPSIFIDLQIPLLYLNNIFALAIGPQHQGLRVAVSLPVHILLIAQSLYRQWRGPWGDHYALNCVVCSCTFIYVDWVLLKSPDKEAWRKIQYGGSGSKAKGKGVGGVKGGVKEQGKGKNAASVPQTFWGRVWWGLRLSTTARYVGWSCEVKNVPKEVDAGYSRIRFIARKTLRAVFFYFLKDFIYAYAAASPHGTWRDIAHLRPAVSNADASFWSRFSYAWLHIVLAYAALELWSTGYGIISVATGLANPRDCPSAFGDLKRLVSVRNAWSVVWHQNCRRVCSAPGIYVARDVLRLPRGSFASKYLQLFIGFGISALVHGGASMLVHRSFEDDAAFGFFIGQAVIIMVEDHVIDFGKRLGLKDSLFWRLVGFCWTVFAIGASCERYTSKMIGNEIWVLDRAPDWFGIGPVV
ncbi:Uu.00g075960.m01.CDS01 [Anthostomella pinea]|uniref:Uu.00g075960.m01.CDS01 n=1 Tax=Anthostomella pinea TaxID=933095 RepID=A0AAI8VVS5_9PEZI|nr:Uu.00g075960.m01.CDS01 [Anthostomella pinea]